MSVKYKILFIVELLHDYYANAESKEFSIVPSENTRNILRGNGMIYKMVGNKMLVAVKVDGNAGDVPFVPVNPQTHLSFYILPEAGGFLNYTSLSYNPSQPQRYYLHNINQTNVGGRLYLSHPVPEYNAANDYPIGSLASNAGSEVFESIKTNLHTSSHGLGETDYWVNKGVTQYVNNSDLLEFTTSLYQFPVTAPDTNFTIRIFGLNIASGIYDVQVNETEMRTFDAPQSMVAIRMEALPAGRYRVQVNAESRDVYMDTAAVYSNVLGVVEIFNHLPSANAFALFNADGTSKQNTFSIRFANRSVVWKYRTRTADITSVSDVDFSFSSPAANLFTSNKPIPLTEAPRNTITIHSTALGNITPVANPPRDKLQTVQQGGDTYLCAEKFLNY